LVDLRCDEEAFGTAANTKSGVSHPEIVNASYEPLYNAEHQVIEERHPGAEILEHTVERRTIPDEQAGSAVRS
jgi:hypothetical protein